MAEKEDGLTKVVNDQMQKIESNNNQFGVGKITNMKEFIVEVVGLDDVFFYEKINLSFA